MSTALELRSEPRPSPRIVLGPAWNGASLTPREFDAVKEWDEDFVYELIHGVVIVSPVPMRMETGPNELLGQLLLNYWDLHRPNCALDYTFPEQYVRTHDSRRRADRLIWTGLGRMPRIKQNLPTIIVEFVSATKRDRQRDYIEKRDEYLELGVKEYWVIDRFQKCMTVFTPWGASFRAKVIQPRTGYQTKLLPGFKPPLKRLLDLADVIAAAEEETEAT
jgi:Uma2 family endonuclease